MRFLFCLLVVLSPLFGFSQLSGDYTIGGTDPDYLTFTEACAAVSSEGLDGAVTFHARPGTYNEVFNLAYIFSPTPETPLTFRSETGNAEDVIITGTPAGSGSWHVFQANLVYNLILEHLTFETDSDPGIPLDIRSCPNITIRHCNFSAPNYLDNCCGAPYNRSCIDVDPLDNVYIQHCNFQGGGNGIHIDDDFGETELCLIEGNTFLDCEVIGVSVFDTEHVVIRDNYFETTDAGNSYGFYGVSITASSDSIVVEGNDFFLESGSEAIRMLQSDGSDTEPSVISNNEITIINNAYLVPDIAISFSACDYLDIHHNSIYMDLGGYDEDAVFYHEYTGAANTSATNIRIRNNAIWVDTDVAVYDLDQLDCLTACDHNVIHQAGISDLAARIGQSGDEYGSVAAWTSFSGWDANTLTDDPLFRSPQNLESCNTALMEAALPLGVTQDVSGWARDMVAPDIGSHEFYGNPCPADRTGDGQINSEDILTLLGAYGCALACDQDLDYDCEVGAADLLILLGAFNTTCGE